MENLFSTVLRMSATGALVILAVLLARLALRRAPRVFSYALWAVVLFRLLCPLTIESAFSLLPSARVVDVPNPEQGVSQVIQVDTGISAVDRPVNDFFIQHPYQGVPVLPEGNVPAAPPSVFEPTPAPPIQQSGPVSDWRTVPAMVWLAGVGLLLAYSLISLLRLRRRLVGWVPLEGEKNVRLADHIPSPFVLGVFRPKIYLPSGLLSEERDYILLHERTHIRRLDHILRALAWLALAVHWFNPLVWLAFHLAGRDMEMSCDEAVLQKMGRDIRADYSSSLLRLSVGGRLPAGPLAFGSGDPQGRIKNVLNYKKPALWVMVAALIAVLCAGAALATNQISPLIDPNSVISVTSFDASSRTITPQNTGVYTTADLRKDLLNPVNPQVLSRESGIELVRLINSHRKTVYGHGELTLNGWEHHLKRIDCADGSFYVMDYWYWNGFSFSPFHMGEDDYTTLVTYFDAEGNPGTTWQMEYNFDLAYWNLRYDIGQTNKVVNSVAADLSLTLDQLDDGVPFVRISGTADGIPLERTSWNPPEWFAQFGSESAAIYPLGKLWFEVPLCDNEVICALDACWTDESRSAVKVTATPRAMISSYSIAGNLIFTVNLSKDGGTLAELDGYVPKLAAGAPELVPTEAEAVRAGLIAARLLTAAENFYDESMAALAEKQGDGLTFSLGAHGSYVRLSGSVDGLPVSSAASWQPDSIFDVDVLGNLFIPYPPFGEDEDGMVYAWWENEDRTAVTITGQPLALSTSGRDYTGWLTFTIALGKDGSAAYQSSYVKGTEENVYLASLSEEEMIAFGRYAAKLLTAAEDYYNNCMTGGSANERSYVLSHEEDGETVVVIQGLGAYLEWMAPNPIFSGGWLYFGGDPTFCCPALAGEEIDGNAMWTDEGALWER